MEEGQEKKKILPKKWIPPKRDAPADEMRGTFWDLTNMFHYKFGPQTTEGFLNICIFNKPGEVAAVMLAL